MLRRPNPKLMIDRVWVMPVDTEMRDDGFPAITDSIDPNDGTEYECQVYDARGAYSSMGSFDERMAEEFRDMGNAQYVILFVEDPQILTPRRLLLWRSNGLGSRKVTYDPPRYLVSVAAQLDRSGGRFCLRVGANALSL